MVASQQSEEKATMSTRPAGRIALVAGGTGGLGAAVSLAFLEEGAHVAVTYRTPSELDGLAKAASAHAARLEGHRADVTDEAATSQLAQAIVAQHGRIDALVNCVGGYAGGVKLADVDTKVLDHLLALNLRSGYALVRAVLPHMLKQKAGAIVNVAAKAALEPPAGAAPYAASKAAALALMNSLAAEVAGTGVRVNSILPSIIDTPPNRAAMPKADHAKWPKPEELARVVLFLCSDDAAAIHGASIPVYGAR
jgi:NAD(P)-dependent dehydrogenase (short-subunit alcohol dehydrogenase family)